MRPTLFLHIGLHKTGSTFLQHFCAINRDRLREQGVMYPRAAIQWHGHHPLVWSMGVNHPHHNPEAGDTAFYIRQLIEEFDNHVCQTLLLSSEDFEFMNSRNMDVLRKLFERFEIRVLAYLRRQDSYLESEYAQHVRMNETRFSGSIKDFYMRFDFMQRYNYLQLLQPYADRFGTGNIVVRPFQRSQFEGGELLQDFCHAVGINLTDEMEIPADGLSNISLSGDTLKALRAINRIDLADGERSTILKILNRHARSGKKPATDDKTLAGFRALFAESNARVAQVYLGRENGQLFFEDSTSS